MPPSLQNLKVRFFFQFIIFLNFHEQMKKRCNFKATSLSKFPLEDKDLQLLLGEGE